MPHTTRSFRERGQDTVRRRMLRKSRPVSVSGLWRATLGALHAWGENGGVGFNSILPLSSASFVAGVSVFDLSQWRCSPLPSSFPSSILSSSRLYSASIDHDICGCPSPTLHSEKLADGT